MQDNKQSPLWHGSAKNIEITADNTNKLKEENQILIQENISLKKSFESEQTLHNNLYKDWKQLKENERAEESKFRKYKSAPLPSVSKAAFNRMLLITLGLTVLTVYNLVANRGEKINSSSAASVPVASDTSAQLKQQMPQLHDSQVVSTDNTNKKDASSSEKVPTSSAKVSNTPQTSEHKKHKPDTIYTSKNAGLYKVKSKAFFYNQPNGDTRRNAFINHWNNSYATLRALDEKDGFVYIVFTNHAGQTSKGWLLKSDLYPVEENNNQ